MTSGEVRVGQESAGHLGSTPLPVTAAKLDIAEVLAYRDGIILTRKWDLEDDLICVKVTIRHPELRTLRGERRKEDKEKKMCTGHHCLCCADIEQKNVFHYLLNL